MELTTAQPARGSVPHRPGQHRVARAAARRRVAIYTATVTVAGFAWLVLAMPAAAQAAGRDPGPVLLLAALVLAAELIPLELGRPGTRDSTTMSQPFPSPSCSAGAPRPGWSPSAPARPWPTWRPAGRPARCCSTAVYLACRGAIRADRERARAEAAAEQARATAAKHSPDHRPVRLEATRLGGLAVLAVEDRGPGVSPADRERVFERFTQLDSGATRRAGGVGLGLYIARQLANAQGGELLCTDPVPPGQGARFELRLPLAEVDQPESLLGRRPSMPGAHAPGMPAVQRT
jgi:hypothetical protein